jgi:hypothetical protein
VSGGFLGIWTFWEQEHFETNWILLVSRASVRVGGFWEYGHFAAISSTGW